MAVDKRVRYGRAEREAAVSMFAEGRTYIEVASALSIPAGTVKQWGYAYEAFGPEGVLTVGGKRHRYPLELRIAAARAVVEEGRPRGEVMGEFGIWSVAPLEEWCRRYREGGEEAVRYRALGRPRSAATEERLQHALRTAPSGSYVAVRTWCHGDKGMPIAAVFYVDGPSPDGTVKVSHDPEGLWPYWTCGTDELDAHAVSVVGAWLSQLTGKGVL